MKNHLSLCLTLVFIISLLSTTSSAQEFSAREWKRLSGYSSYVWDVQFSPEGTYFALTVDDNTTELYNSNWRQIWRHQGHCTDDHHHAGTLAFSPDEKYLAIGSHGDRSEIAILRLADLRVIQLLKGHSDAVRSVSFSPDGSYLASVSADQTLKIWRRAGGRFITHQTLRGHSDTVWSVHFDPKGNYLASGSRDNSIRIWRQTNHRFIFHQELRGHSDCVKSVHFSPDGKYLASGSCDKTLRIWRHAGNGFAYAQSLTGHTSNVWDVSFSPDGNFLASSSRDKTIRIWYNSRQFYLTQTLPQHQDEVNSVSFSLDGNYLAGGSDDKTAKIWQVDGIGVGYPPVPPVPQGLTKALDFQVKALNGEPLSLEKYRGKVILLDFWATWCGPCLAEMPNVKRIYRNYQDQNFEIIGISLDSNSSQLRSYLWSERITWPQFFDGAGWENSVARKYGINSIPTMYLIDGNGFIREEDLRGRALEVAVAKLVAENNRRMKFRNDR